MLLWNLSRQTNDREVSIKSLMDNDVLRKRSNKRFYQKVNVPKTLLVIGNRFLYSSEYID